MAQVMWHRVPFVKECPFRGVVAVACGMSGLRARKRERVHDGLIQAALELFIDRGFDATTIDDVAARADVSRRTFFRYFQSKEDCVLAWADQICAEILRGLEQRPAREPPWLAFRAVAVEVLAVYQRDRDHFYPLESLIATTPTIRAAKRERMGPFADVCASDVARRDGSEAR